MKQETTWFLNFTCIINNTTINDDIAIKHWCNIIAWYKLELFQYIFNIYYYFFSFFFKFGRQLNGIYILLANTSIRKIAADIIIKWMVYFFSCFRISCILTVFCLLRYYSYGITLDTSEVKHSTYGFPQYLSIPYQLSNFHVWVDGFQGIGINDWSHKIHRQTDIFKKNFAP